MKALKTILETVQPLYGVTEWSGCNEQEIAYLEELFGTFSPLLKEFYATAAATEQLHNIQDSWILPKDLKKYKALHHKDYFILVNENQGACCAGIRKQDLHLENPPVYVSDWQENWSLCASTLSEFLFGFLLYQSVFAMEFGTEEFLCLTEEEGETLQEKLQEYPCCVKNWIGVEQIRFFHCAKTDVAVLMDCGEYQLLYGAQTEQDFESLEQLLQGMGEPM